METLLKEGRTQRDALIEEANNAFDGLIVKAYTEGLTLHEIHMMTGVSVSTLRVKLAQAGRQPRSTGPRPRKHTELPVKRGISPRRR